MQVQLNLLAKLYLQQLLKIYFFIYMYMYIGNLAATGHWVHVCSKGNKMVDLYLADAHCNY